MTTYGAMQDRIADELTRSDLGTQIQREIQSAVAHYESERFWFNEGQYTLTTETAVEAYSITTVLDIDSVAITVSGHPYDLRARPFQYIDQIRDPSYTGRPDDYAVFNDQMYLCDIPDATYTIVISGCLRLATLSATADTNAWMTSGEEMIRCRAKSKIYLHILRDTEAAGEMAAMEREAYEKLAQKTASKIKSGSLTPTQF